MNCARLVLILVSLVLISVAVLRLCRAAAEGEMNCISLVLILVSLVLTGVAALRLWRDNL